MRNLYIKTLFPYNWCHIRKIKIYDDKGTLLIKVMHGEEPKVLLPEDCRSVTIKLDFYKSVIPVPANGENIFLGIYMDFRDKFPHKYIDTLKRKLITGHFMSEEEYNAFNLSFYTNAMEFIPISKVDKPAVLLGIIIASVLVILSVIQQQNPYKEIVFLIGASSIISLLMIAIEKQKILLYDYKSRIIATAAAFVLAFLFLTPLWSVNMLMFIFISLFILRAVAIWKTIKI
ncbi:hypothetical protein [Flavobacterium rhizosphaerae]|uniref:Uncharacterized protein n=1 Tax=Flavobacterium rhizosphaerae TaxID=3163298 RepID=A0ABW8YUC2_9FLAO